LSKQKAGLRTALRDCSQQNSASWLEPLREVVQTLNEATNLNSATDYAQMSKIVRKIGTNHQISNGIATYTLVPPYDSVASVLADFANTPKPVAPLSALQTVERQFLCRLLDAVRTSFTDGQPGSNYTTNVQYEQASPASSRLRKVPLPGLEPDVLNNTRSPQPSPLSGRDGTGEEGDDERSLST
jgi:hypothetical protein